MSLDWIKGDSTGLSIPAHIEALRSGGADFLTEAFRAVGALDDDNRVAAITDLREVTGGSTGRKALLSVEYEKQTPELHRELFVKFSRDFDNDIRDRARTQMELEVLFALLSRDPEFPIPVPACYFSDYHHESGTGILIAQRIFFDRDGVEPHYPKCLDYRIPDQLGHYRALITSLARLAGTHRAGRLPDTVEKYFPFDPGKLVVSRQDPLTPEQLGRRIEAYAEFVRDYPQLFPANIRSEAFIDRLRDEAPQFQALLEAAHNILLSQPDMIALCHWNAHVDNAWFWRNAEGELECGLMDWGNVSQMNIAMALWGCLSAAEPEIWNDHLDDLLDLFAAEFSRSGGPTLDTQELKYHFTVYVGTALAWMIDMPRYTLGKIAGLEQVKDRFDPLIADNERARSQLLILSAVLNLWEKEDMATVVEQMERFTAQPAPN